MIAPAPAVSIVLPCYNRAAYLNHWLAACASWQPSRESLEVIVVDDGGADHAEAIVERWGERGLAVRYLRLRGAGGPRNNARARNAGIRAARHPLVLNSDPDVVFVTDVVRKLVAEWQPGTLCSLTGYYPLSRASTRALWRIAEQRPLTADDYRAQAVGCHNLVQRPDGVYGLHGAFLCDRDTLTRLRGYDERFQLWGWEDRDLLTRLQRGLGFTRRFVTGATVVHQWHPALRADHDPHDRTSRSRVLWQMGWQQACATTMTSIERNGGTWGEESLTSGETSIAASRLTPSVHAAAATPAEQRLLFDAYRHEAQVWWREGQSNIALACLRTALTRWWETGDRALARDEDAVFEAASFDTQLMQAHAAGYAHARDLAIEYAAIAEACGDAPAADVALGAADRMPGHRTAIVHLRARRQIAEGHLDRAVALLEACLGASAITTPDDADTARPEALARAVELNLQLGRLDRARSWVRDALDAARNDRPAAPSTDDALGCFDRLLFEAYRVTLHPGADAHHAWPPRLGDDEAGEFLFSAAMRARRAGLVVGSHALFTAYLALASGEESLRVRARAYLDEIARCPVGEVLSYE
jgi:glycosyltransferase involved in cell wall biosynthesis/tetratricopeptide (TPR) repeat protein